MGFCQVRMWSSRVAQDAPTSTSAKVNEKLGSKIISFRQKSLRTFCIREAWVKKIKNKKIKTMNIMLHSISSYMFASYILCGCLLIRELCTSIENKGTVDNSICGWHAKHLEKPVLFSCYSGGNTGGNICMNRQFSWRLLVWR
jgi:hypothetical protein